MSHGFLFEKDGPVTTLTFNRPQRRNCMNHEVMCEMDSLIRQVGDDPGTRVLIATGNGAALSRGRPVEVIDLRQAHRVAPGTTSTRKN